jgi:hypothetical protein
MGIGTGQRHLGGVKVFSALVALLAVAAISACGPGESEQDKRADSDANLLFSNQAPHVCPGPFGPCLGGVQVPVSRDLQLFARQTACQKGISQNLLLALMVHEQNNSSPDQQIFLLDHRFPDKSLGITSMKYQSALGLIHQYGLHVPEAGNRRALEVRIAHDPKLDIELAADLLKSGHDDNLVDMAAFTVAYTQPTSAWTDFQGPQFADPNRYPAKPLSLNPRDDIRQSLRDRAASYAHYLNVLQAADDWLSLPPSVTDRATQKKVAGQLVAPKLSLPYDVGPIACAPPTTPASAAACVEPPFQPGGILLSQAAFDAIHGKGDPFPANPDSLGYQTACGRLFAGFRDFGCDYPHHCAPGAAVPDGVIEDIVYQTPGTWISLDNALQLVQALLPADATPIGPLDNSSGEPRQRFHSQAFYQLFCDHIVGLPIYGKNCGLLNSLTVNYSTLGNQPDEVFGISIG